MSTEHSEIQPAGSGLARNASWLALGNIASRGFGLLRENVIADHFGAGGEVSAFRIALQIPTLLYDFLVGGMLSAALIPVLSETAQRGRRDYVQLVHSLVAIFTVGLTLLVLLLVWAAPFFARVMAVGFLTQHPELFTLTIGLIRQTAPLIWLLGLTGLLTAVLYTQHQFSLPALATAIYNLGIVIAAPLLAPRVGISALVVGLLAGAGAQIGLLIWGVARSGIAERLQVNWHHPALGKILRLYAPIAAGMVVSLFQVGLDRRLASTTNERSIAWMSNATTLQQLPLGLISVAIAIAALPRLSQLYLAQDEPGYRQTLSRGLHLVLILLVPAAVGLWLLGTPITRLIFEHGRFTSTDTTAVVQALNIYLIGMLFAAIDFPLNYAFYARNNTLWPALVGVLSVGVYVIVAFALLEWLGYLGLVWADTAKQASHALVMIGLLMSQIGRRGLVQWRTLAALGVASGVMSLTIRLVANNLMPWLPGGWLGDLLMLGVAGGSGALIYLATLYGLGVREIQQIGATIGRRLLNRTKSF